MLLSPTMQSLIDNGLLDRLPPTFATFFFDQFESWNLLFPAEQNYLERLFSLLARSEPRAVETAFKPLRDVELRMGVNESTWPRKEFALKQVQFVNRSPLYQEWRQAVSNVFARLDPLLDAETARHGRPRLVLITAPAELPVGSDRMWLRLKDRGKRIALNVPDAAEYMNLLCEGDHGKFIGEVYSKEPYDSWVISAEDSHAAGSATTFCYAAMKNTRARLMSEVQRIVESGDVRGPGELVGRLKKLRLGPADGKFANDPILAEFIRAVLLTGNGTLLINNTFVEWAAIQAIRRARPALLVASFGVRNKLKPFSSLLMYSDQEKVNPIPAQMDALGTYVDLEVFYQYIWQEAERYAEYRQNTAYLFAADGMDELFCIAPPDFPLLSAKTPVGLAQVFETMKTWLNV
jgi:hypothetical protein